MIPHPLSPITAAIYQSAPPPTDADLTLAERPERLQGAWGPLERLLDGIEATGDIDTARGKPIFREGNAWYEIAPAVDGIVEFHAMAYDRHGIYANTAPQVRLSRKLDLGAPLFESDISAARSCIAMCKCQAARLTVGQAVSIVRTIQIGIEIRRTRNG